MAEFIDEFDSPSEIDAVEAQQEQQSSEEVEHELPEKYRGKKVADIVRMHQEAEKALSRQGQEMGEVRKLADELLKVQLNKPAEKKDVPEEIDFFENPQEAIRRAVESSPDVIAAKQYALQAKQEQAKQMLMSKHPDFTQVVQDAEFAEWVKASPVRTRLYNEAEAYDVDAADELLSTFKQIKAVKQAQAQQADVTARNAALAKASVDTGGSGESSKKVFRRADLIRLKMTDPRRYDAMQDEIQAAYQEGRVK